MDVSLAKEIGQGIFGRILEWRFPPVPLKRNSPEIVINEKRLLLFLLIHVRQETIF